MSHAPGPSAAASGLPMGITTATPEVAASFKGLTLSTYGGNPLSSVAALATLHVMSREDIPRRAARLGSRLRSGLEALQDKHPLIGDVRGMGLMTQIDDALGLLDAALTQVSAVSL